MGNGHERWRIMGIVVSPEVFPSHRPEYKKAEKKVDVVHRGIFLRSETLPALFLTSRCKEVFVSLPEGVQNGL